MSKHSDKGRYLQLQFYVSDPDEKLILSAGVSVPRFLDVAVQDAVLSAKQHLGVE